MIEEFLFIFRKKLIIIIIVILADENKIDENDYNEDDIEIPDGWKVGMSNCKRKFFYNSINKDRVIYYFFLSIIKITFNYYFKLNSGI